MSTWTPKPDPLPWDTIELIIGGIIPIGLIVIGTLGNILCIGILLSEAHQQTSTNVYLIFLCLMDTISLYQWNLSRALQVFTNNKQTMWGSSLIMCKLSQFFPYYTLHTSAIFLTFVELDRACLLRSIWFKNKIARPRIALIISILILICFLAIDGFLFGLGFETSTYNNSTGTVQTKVSCFYSLNTDFYNFYVYPYITMHLVIMYIIPFSVIVICTLLTINKLFIGQISTNEQLARSAYRNRRISFMLLLMCLAYIICTLPNRLYFSVFKDQIMGHDYTDTVLLGSNTLMYARNAIDIFFLYISIPAFREDVNKLVFKCIRKVPTENELMQRTQQTRQTTTRNNN
ncbi:unnamed protein product [Rotaria sp. Silwood1]|nr:unnamed protein product [Rotaria sp. Silwood1]